MDGYSQQARAFRTRGSKGVSNIPRDFVSRLMGKRSTTFFCFFYFCLSKYFGLLFFLFESAICELTPSPLIRREYLRTLLLIGMVVFGFFFFRFRSGKTGHARIIENVHENRLSDFSKPRSLSYPNYSIPVSLRTRYCYD